MKWQAEPITHKGEARIALHFEYSTEANKKVKQLTGAKWSITLKVWHVPDNKTYRKQFGLKEKEPAYITSFPDADNQKRLKAAADKIRLKGYSKQTVGSPKFPF